MACTTQTQCPSRAARGWSATTQAPLAGSDPLRTVACSSPRLGLVYLLLTIQSLMAIAAPAAAEHPLTEAVKAAVIMANGLERAYWENPSAFSGWDAVYAHFRRGYSKEIAERMTEFTLDNDGDLATWVPTEVHVAEVDNDSALAYFKTPPEFGLDGLWGFEAYMVVRLRRENGRWIIDWATDSATPPRGTR